MVNLIARRAVRRATAFRPLHAGFATSGRLNGERVYVGELLDSPCLCRRRFRRKLPHA